MASSHNMFEDKSYFGEDPKTVWIVVLAVTLGFVAFINPFWRESSKEMDAAIMAQEASAAEAEAAARTARELEFERTVVRDPVADAKFRQDIGLPPNNKLQRTRGGSFGEQ